VEEASPVVFRPLYALNFRFGPEGEEPMDSADVPAVFGPSPKAMSSTAIDSRLLAAMEAKEPSTATHEFMLTDGAFAHRREFSNTQL
jgi:hypothetical protein